jgi:hypothetical protein
MHTYINNITILNYKIMLTANRRTTNADLLTTSHQCRHLEACQLGDCMRNKSHTISASGIWLNDKKKH